MSTTWPKWLAAALVGVGIGVVVTPFIRGEVATEADASMKSPMAAGDVPTGQHKTLWHCGMHPQVIQDHPGDCPICHMALTRLGSSDTDTDAAKPKVLYWWDPMLGTSSISDHPGKSAMGMDLVPVYGEQAGPSVTINPTVVQNMGVRTAPVERGPLGETIRAVGLLTLPEPGLHDINSKVGGWIDKLYADQDGMHVHEGEPLYEMYSQDLLVAEQELISAVKSERALPSDTSPDLRRETTNMIDSAKRKLRLWDVAEQDIDAIAKADEPPKDVPFRSPATGHIEDKVVVQGSAVQPMMKLMRVADHTKMWLDAQIYSEQIQAVKIGQSVVASVDGMAGQDWKGTITFLYPHVDHMTRTLTARITLDNPDFALKPGMYASVEIAAQPVPDAIQVPREAVIDTGVRQIAFVSDGEGHFSPRKVKVGMSGDDDKVQIIEGLAPGETVVTSGQFLLDVESRTIEATQKLSSPMTNDAGTTQPNTSILPPTTMPGSEMPTGGQPMPPMPGMDAVASGQPASRPAERLMLAVAFCPMVKQHWLQSGEAIANPYMGQTMSTCGTVQRHVVAASDATLGTVIQSYLDIGSELNADKFDSGALQSLNAAASMLQGERYAALRDSAANMASAKDLASERSTFHEFSDRLIRLLETSGQ